MSISEEKIFFMLEKKKFHPYPTPFLIQKTHIIAVFALRMIIANTVIRFATYFNLIPDINLGSSKNILDIWEYVTGKE